MKIFLTGGSGFVGKNLFEFYSPNFDVVLYKRGEDITERLNQEKPEFIINSAAEIYQAESMFDSNLVLVNEILSYCVRSDNLKRFIQIGSSSEYGRKSNPSSERDSLEPQTIYEGTKAAASLLCVAHAKSFSLPIVVARPYSVYGPHEKPHRLFPKLIDSFFKNKPMKLHQGWHDFIYIKDFVRGIDILLNEEESKVRGDIVNFGSGKQHSNFEIYAIIKSMLHRDGVVELEESFLKVFESLIWICNTDYAKSKYGFQTNFDIEAGIFDLLKENRHALI